RRACPARCGGRHRRDRRALDAPAHTRVRPSRSLRRGSGGVPGPRARAAAGARSADPLSADADETVASGGLAGASTSGSVSLLTGGGPPAAFGMGAKMRGGPGHGWRARDGARKQRHAALIVLRTAALLLFAGSCFAASAANASGGEIVTVSGVLRTTLGQPVPNVHVFLQGEGSNDSGVTGADGSYSL